MTLDQWLTQCQENKNLHLLPDLLEKERLYELFKAFCQPNDVANFELCSDFPKLAPRIYKQNEEYAAEYWIWMDEIIELQMELTIESDGDKLKLLKKWRENHNG